MTSTSVNASPMELTSGHDASAAEAETSDYCKHNEEAPQTDAFGDEALAEIKYKVLTWWQGGLLMVAETISLGILSLPAAISQLGLVPGLVIMIGMGILASYNGYVIGQIKWRFPQISSMSDAGEILMGAFGREFFGIIQLLLLIFIMASHILTFTIAFNVITAHATCSIVFGIITTAISLILSVPRTLRNISWLSIVSFISILSAVILTMITVAIKRPDSVVQAVASPDLVTGFGAVTNIVFAYASHNAFFTFIAELSDPREFPKALALLQSVDISLYVVASVVIYYYAGVDVTSPAIGSAGAVAAKIAYGISLPTILIAGVINGHIAAKSIYLRIFAGTDRIHKRDWTAVLSWIGIMLLLWIIAWIIAESIPIFGDLLGLIASLFLSWFTFGLPSAFWFYMNKGLWFTSARKIFLSCVNMSSLVIGCTVCILGLYSSGVVYCIYSQTDAHTIIVMGLAYVYYESSIKEKYYSSIAN
ncbi:N amino acid transport system protein [Talaromyces islandicus]|uniref:N amino acid transport system protein n=1 Tax=Talaromyces islandicus TaxID=28573 RepID=A0A0U1LJV2_TALIS|nr:N amino acid transport system protein [Talaromyces islandicus]